MQIRQLLTFVTVSKTKNMAQAALALNYSHSTIYGHLESLEKEFNFKLYNRTSHGVELTEEGERFLIYAKRFIDLYNEITDDLAGNAQTSIRIGASESGDVCFMHSLLQKYIELSPHVEIEYMKMTSEVALSKLMTRTCDFAMICEFHFQSEDIYAQYLGSLPLVFVTSPAYLIGMQNNGTELPKLIGTMKLPVALTMMQSINLEFNQYFSLLSNIGDLDTIKQLVLYNRGIALLPEMYIRQDIQDGLLVRIPNLMQTIPLDVFVGTPSKIRIGPHTQRLIDLTFELFNPNHLTEANILE